MQWFGRRESTNVEDRRGMSGGGMAAGGGIIGLPIYLVYSFFGGSNTDPSQMPQLPQQVNPTTRTPEEQKADDERAQFVKVVLAETEDVWNKILSDAGKRYSVSFLFLCRDGVNSACGNASSA